MSQSQHTIQRLWKLKHPISGGLHLLGFLAALTAVLFHVFRPNEAIHPCRQVYAYVFLATMALLYLSSSLYHLVTANAAVTACLRKLDHAMISLFIAGTVTPFCLSFESSTAKAAMIVAIWLLAFFGVVFTSLFTGVSRWVRVGAYIGLSLFGLVTVGHGFARFDAQVLIWLFAGGIAYLVGSTVYALRRPNPSPRFFGFHEIWHVFVIFGCTCHYIAVNAFLTSGV